MGQIKISSFVSLDGVVEDPTQVVQGYFDDECVAYAHNALKSAEYFLMGRISYDMFVARWPAVGSEGYIGHINGMKKLVVSRTLQSVSWNATLLAADAPAALAEIKRQTPGDIIKYGVGILDRMLLNHGLVDTYDLWIIPKIIGAGKRAFEDVSAQNPTMHLNRTHQFANGVVVLNYSVTSC